MLVTDEFHWVIALFCLIVSVSLQIGVNYANDYSDGVRGTDDHRVGPTRLTASRKVKPRAVLIVALLFFAIAAGAGLAITIRTQQWWLIAVGAVCILAAWFYTGGKRPYGYYGLGELFVFVFFGLVATLGTDVGAGARRCRRRPGSAPSARVCWRAPCCSRTTCATSTRTARPASAPSRC